MADDLGNIEIGVVFRDRGDGMKKAVTVAERLERQLDKLVKAANQGSISQQRFQQKLIIAGRELKKNSDMTGNQAYGAVVKYTNAVRKQIVAQENSSVAMQKNTQAVKSAYVAQQALGKGMNRTGVIAQQAGYQFGDFFVQVQSGTNVMVAFGQQATQLIGTFAMLAKSTRAIMLLSGLGVVVPILTAIAAGIMRTKEAAEGAEEKVKTFEDRLRSSQTAIDSAQNSVVDLTNKGLENLREKFGAVTTEVIALEDRLNRIELKAMTTEIQEAMNSLFSPEFFSAIEDKFGAIGSAIAESTTEEIEFTRQEIKYLEQTIQNSNFAMPELEGQLVTLREELAAMTGDFENMGSLKDELTLSYRTIEAYKELETTIKSATAEGNFQAAADGISKMLLLFEGVGIEIDSGALANMSRLEAVLREAVATLDDAVPLATTLSKYFGDAADEAQRMALNLQQAAMSAEQTAEGNITVMVAQMKALNAGQDEYIAGARARLNLEKEAYQEALVAAGLSVKEAQLATESNFKHRDAALETTEAYRELQGRLKEVGNKGPKSAEDTRTAYEKAMMTAKEFADALDQQVLGAVDGVADAFSNFLQRGMKDFKSFVGSIKDMFIRLLADMAAMALKRQILIPIAAGFAGGFGSAAAGATTANLIAGGGMAGSLAAGASSFGAGLQASLGMGGFTSAGVFNVGANAAVATAATGVGASATMATLGAAVPLIAAGVALFSLFGKKKKPAISPENMNKVNQALIMTGQELGATGREAEQAAAALGEVAGGFDKLTKKAQAFYEGFYTEGERRTIAINEATQALNKTFAELEMAVPKTHSEFRQLVEAQDLMTEEGRETYNALLDISGAFVTLNGTMQETTERAATLRQEELALREARSLAKLQPFIGEDAAAATLERLSGKVYSGNIKTLVDGVFQEIFEALTPDATQMGKITPYLEELTEQLEEIVKNLSATDDILRKYASGDIIGEIRKFTKQMQREIRYLVDFSGGTPEGIAFGVFNSVKRAAQDITRIAKEMSKDLGTIFTEFAAEFKVENVLDESRKVTDRIDELLSAFTATRNSLLSSYTKAVRAFDHAPSFDRTTEAGREAFEEMQQAGEALAEAQREIEKLTTTINTLSTSSRAFEQAVADKLVEPIREALTVYLPTALDDLPQDIKNTMGGLFAGITEGSLEGFQSAYVQLAELFTTNKITVDQFNDSFKIMEDVFRGNISLTDEYTTKQQSVIERLSRAYGDFTGKLENLLGVVRGGIDALLGQSTSASVVSSRRGSQAYLRTVARTGQFDAGRLERAVGAVSAGDTTGFGSRQEFLRYVADTTALLRTVEGTLSGQLDTLQMQQVKAILNIQDTNETAATSLQSIQNLLAEFLGVGGRIPTFATGGYHAGGLRIVGERGPELEATGPSRIIPAGKFSVGGNAELRREVAELRVDLKAALVQIAKNTRKSSDTLNKFDYQGLPNSRGY